MEWLKCTFQWCVCVGCRSQESSRRHWYTSSRSVSLLLCLSFALSLCRSVSLSLCLSVALSLCRSVSLLLCLSVLCVCVCVCVFVCDRRCLAEINRSSDFSSLDTEEWFTFLFRIKNNFFETRFGDTDRSEERRVAK